MEVIGLGDEDWETTQYFENEKDEQNIRVWRQQILQCQHRARDTTHTMDGNIRG